jgi:2-phospho-L-lactate/phosphoenolpyruvate guanylyltransferase
VFRAHASNFPLRQTDDDRLARIAATVNATAFPDCDEVALRHDDTLLPVRTAAILPVKRFPLAKQRLGASVADSLRLDLARAMVGDVLAALRECAAVDATIVVTQEPAVQSAARYLGAIVLDDTAEDGQSAAAALGIARALADRFERVVCVPGDCPALDPGELAALLGRSRRAVTIVPDRHGSGTNGLLLSPPDAISPSFGPDSRARHERLASEAGVAWRVEAVASLLLDVDTGDDLAELRERLAGERVRAPRTRAVLGPGVQSWRSSRPAA